MVRPPPSLVITAAGLIQDGGGLELGYRDIPLVTYAGASVLGIGDRGRCHYKIDATQVTIPSGVFLGGKAVTIWNHAGPSMTIVQGAGLSMFKGGTTTTGNRTLAGVGVATVLFSPDGTQCVISGSGLT